MFQYRQAFVRLRTGDTVREVVRTGLMGRDKLGELRSLALSRGWLTAAAELPDDASLAAALAPRRRAASTVSSVEPLRSVGRNSSEVVLKAGSFQAFQRISRL